MKGTSPDGQKAWGKVLDVISHDGKCKLKHHTRIAKTKRY